MSTRKLLKNEPSNEPPKREDVVDSSPNTYSEREKMIPPPKTVFDTLSEIDLSNKLEKKDGFSYLSWAFAWGVVKKLYPSASYRVLPIEEDANLGFMCNTEVTINGETLHMWLPVMDSKHKSMKREEYSYTTKYGPKTVEPATMHDINRTNMRCLVKNLAMFGLGLYVFAGEDIPVEKVESAVATQHVGQPIDKRVQLLVSSPNWAKVSDYVKANKNLGLDSIIEQLSRKYIITENAHTSIIKLCNQQD
jgi:hypothetical protein